MTVAFKKTKQKNLVQVIVSKNNSPKQENILENQTKIFKNPKTIKSPLKPKHLSNAINAAEYDI